ncbi:hypothetical protein, partial [Escherichia coli]|uniref:hypothetical protein n=1 Tax=Escherichia coli TaxID=562 RepID=UPI001BFCC185
LQPWTCFAQQCINIAFDNRAMSHLVATVKGVWTIHILVLMTLPRPQQAELLLSIPAQGRLWQAS